MNLNKQVYEERDLVSSSDEDEPSKGSPTKTKIYNENQDVMFQNKIYNRLEDNFHLSNKKALFWNMSEYYRSMEKSPWDALPVTFHIENGLSDPEYNKFMNYYQKVEMEIQHKTMMKNMELARRRRQEAQQKKAEKKEALKVKAKKRGKRVVKSEVSSSESDSNSSEETDSEEEESEDDEFKIPKNMWIVKPGENTNRGNGIQVCSNMFEVQNIIRT